MAYAKLTTIHTPATGAAAPAGWGTQTDDNFEAVAKPPRVRVRRTTNQSILNTTSTQVIFGVEDYDYAAGNVGGIAGGTGWVIGNPTRLVAPIGGTYQAAGGMQFAINATGARLWWLMLNGTTTLCLGHSVGNGTWYTGNSISTDVKMAASDYIELWCYQSSGGALNVDVTYPIWASLRLVALT